MTVAGHLPEVQDPAAAPVVLDQVLALGATLFGRPVRTLRIETTDGRRQSLELPRPARGDRLTGTEQRIVAVLRASHLPLNRKEVARAMGRQNTQGSFGKAFCNLVLAGLIHYRDHEYTDEPAKFPAAETPGGVGLRAAPSLSPLELAVLQVLDEATPGDEITTAEIAERAGYKLSGKMASFLATLVRAGRLVRRANGYELPRFSQSRRGRLPAARQAA